MIILTTQNRNHNPSIFLIMVKLLPLLLLCSLPLTAAQRESSPPPTSLPPQSFTPSLAIVMVVLVSAFFFMGFFSVYVRQCTDRRFQGNHFHPRASVRRSWRMQAGIDPEVIEAYFPTFLYSAVKGLKIGKGSLECAVCLNEFEGDETLRLLPKCSHVFHPDCIGAWLSSHTTCPVCRANLVPTPGDLTLNSGRLFELDNTNNNLVQPDDRSNVNNIDGAQNHVAIHVGGENDQVREATEVQVQPPNVNLINQANHNRSLRSRSTGWQLNKLFSRSYSTTHSLLVEPGKNYERFTLRLSDEARKQLLNTHLNRARSCATFSKAKSSRKGYRSRSVGAEGGRNYFNYERFNQEVAEVFPRTGSSRSTKGVNGNGEENVTPSKNVLRSVRSLKAPLECFFPGSSDKNNNNKDDHSGERSINPLMPGSQV